MLRKIAALLVSAAMFLSLAACGGGGGQNVFDDSTTLGTQPETQEVDKLAGYDFKGKEIRILTSINASEKAVTNSNYMIQGTDSINGEAVNDAVFKRNEDVANLLNVKFTYIPMDADYDTVQNVLSKAILAGTDDYDLVINDLRTLTNLSVKGMFLNFKNNGVFDLDQSYWYKDFIDDVSIGNEKSYILAGDYFIDILRNCHAMFLNKTMLDSTTPGASSELYKKVIDGGWTWDEFLALIKPFLKDVNGDSKFDKNDQYGFICTGTWGSAIPFMMAADTNVVTKDANGIPTISINNPKSLQLFDYLTTLFKTDSGGYSKAELNNLVTDFVNRKSLMVGYQRLSTLQNLRDMPDEMAVLPYPKLNAQQQKYVTSAHDTVEVGAIPATTQNFQELCVVLEAMNRETKKTVIPVYYEQSLKIKYARDNESAQIIDIIHDNMRNVFPLAYSEFLGGLLAVYDVTASKEFTSAYTKIEGKVAAKLEEAVQAILSSPN